MRLNQLTTEIFIERSNKIHNFKYDYGSSIYLTTKHKIKIICPDHGEFEQRANSHMTGNGCPICKNEKASITNKDRIFSSIRISNDEFLIQGNLIHNNKYSYPELYIRGDRHIIIICPEHGEFKQTPRSHLLGHGCKKCSDRDRGKNISKTLDQFISESNIIHNNKYDYSNVEYINTHEKVIIICPNHGEFTQKPLHHIKGHGCNLCSQGPNVSKIEMEWLDSLNVCSENRQKTLHFLDTFKKVDAYDPITNIVYEFYGDFWHGNPIKYNLNEIHPFTKLTYGEMYDNTMNREKLLKEAGYTVISIWESDWNKMIKARNF